MKFYQAWLGTPYNSLGLFDTPEEAIQSLQESLGDPNLKLNGTIGEPMYHDTFHIGVATVNI